MSEKLDLEIKEKGPKKREIEENWVLIVLL